MKVRFNLRETESLPVMVSFLGKGKPTTRIADYLVNHQHMTLVQVDHFLAKLTDLPLKYRNEIYAAAKLMKEHNANADPYLCESYNLKRWLESVNA